VHRKTTLAPLESRFDQEQVRRALFGTPVGDVCLGRFVLKRFLGRGALGRVYEAWDPTAKRPVALKMLPDVDPKQIYRLKREFRALAEVDHPRLVKLFELFNEGEYWFFTMELVNGVHFTDWVRPQGLLDVARLQSALGQLLEGIAALHAHGKLHRDIKPANILVRADGCLSLLDFGLVHEIESQSLSVDFAGTPPYMAPEQITDNELTPAGDLYATGVVLFEALTGCAPFQGNATQQMRTKVQQDAPSPLLFADDLPPHLVALCERLLDRTPARRPSVEEAALALQTSGLAVQSEPASAALITGTFVGRDQELSQLRTALSHAADGIPTVVLVSGESGVGKSALVEHFLAQIGPEPLVLRGRCYAQESVPFKAFDEVLDMLASHLVHLPRPNVAALLPRNLDALTKLFPVLGRIEAAARTGSAAHYIDAREVRNRAFVALKELLLRLTDRHPVVIAVDDIQRADMDSARLLSHLLGSPEVPPILWIWSYRIDEIDTSPFAQVLRGKMLEQVTTLHLPLRPLDPPEARELAHILLAQAGLAPAAANSEIASVVAVESQGLPYLIQALAEHLRIRGGVNDRFSLEQMLQRRMDALPSEVRRLLELVCTAIGPLESSIATAATGLESSDDQIRALTLARLIRTRRVGTLELAEPYHDRIRDGVLSSLGAQQKRALHAAIAAALEATRAAAPEQLVEHLISAGNRARARDASVEAARAAAEKLAFNRSAVLFGMAVELTQDDDPSFCELQEEYAHALVNAGKGAAAGRAYLVAARHKRGRDEMRLRRIATQQLLRAGHTEEGMAVGKQLLAEIDIPFPEKLSSAIVNCVWLETRIALRGYGFESRSEHEVSQELLDRIDILGAMFQEIGVSDVLRGTVLLCHHLRYALEAGEPNRVLQALCGQVLSLSLVMEPYARVSLNRLTELADRIDTPFARATKDLAEAAFYTFTGRYREALEPARRGEMRFRNECAGRVWEANYAAFLRFNCLEFTGSLRELCDEAQARLREATERDDRFFAQLMLMSIPFVHLIQDAPKRALEFLNEQRAGLGPGFSTFHYFVMIRSCETRLYAGSAVAALDDLMSIWPTLVNDYLYKTHVCKADSHYYRARAALGAYFATGDTKARVLAEKDARLLIKTKTGYGGFGTAVRAALAAHGGRRKDAIELIETAIARFEREQADRYATCARYRLGELIGGSRGAALTDAAHEELSEQGIKAPERWVATWLPIAEPQR
jgi:hypothetical protein